MLESGRSLKQIRNRQITARIPHQSKIRDFCQLPPGEAFAPAARNALKDNFLCLYGISYAGLG